MAATILVVDDDADLRARLRGQLERAGLQVMEAADGRQALAEVDVLIHGHTHRPAIHELNGKKRIVLGDWRAHEALILEIDPEQPTTHLQLKRWTY